MGVGALEVAFVPAEAVRATHDVGARVMVPMHWGTFWLSCKPALEPIERTQAVWAAAGRDRADLWNFAVRETARSQPLARVVVAAPPCFASKQGYGQW